MNGIPRLTFAPMRANDMEAAYSFRMEKLPGWDPTAAPFWKDAAAFAARVASREWPEGSVHAWLDGEIVGQLELRRSEYNNAMGYVMFLYLTPPARGRRLGDQLLAYTEQVCRERGQTGYQLRTSELNVVARQLYARNGLLESPIDKERMILLTKTF